MSQSAGEAGIHLAPFTDGMMVNGTPAPVIVDGASTGVVVERDGAENTPFSALLFLMLAAQVPYPLPTDAVELPLVKGNAEGNGNPEASHAAEIPGITNAPTDTPVGDGPSKPDSVSEMPLELSEGATFTLEMHISRSVLPQREAGLHDTVKQPAATESGKDDSGILPSTSRDHWTWPEDSLPAAQRINGTDALDTEGVSVAVLRPSFAIDNPIAPTATSFPAQNATNEPAQLNKESDPKQLAPVAQRQLADSRGPTLRDDATVINETSDEHLAPSSDQPSEFDELKKASGRITSAGNPPSQPLPTAHAKHSSPPNTGTRPLHESQLHTEGEPNSRELPRSSGIVGKVHSPDVHVQNGKQEFAYEPNGSEQFGESFQIDSEPKVESAWRDAVPFQLTHTRDKLPKTTPLESQRTDWRPVIDRVAGEISGRIHIGRQEAVLQLDPPELGKVQIDIHMEGDKLAARILTETQESRMLIEAHLPELRQALGEGRVESVDVRVDSGGWDGQRGGGQHAQQETGTGRQAAPVFAVPGNSQEHEPSQASSLVAQAGRVSMWA